MNKHNNIVMTTIVNGYLEQPSFSKTVIAAVSRYLESPLSHKYHHVSFQRIDNALHVINEDEKLLYKLGEYFAGVTDLPEDLVLWLITDSDGTITLLTPDEY